MRQDAANIPEDPELAYAERMMAERFRKKEEEEKAVTIYVEEAGGGDYIVLEDRPEGVIAEYVAGLES